MALLIRGKSICPLCGAVIGISDEVSALPAFLPLGHRLARFSDAAFHRHCFEASADRVEVEQLLARIKDEMAAGPKTLDEYEAWVKNLPNLPLTGAD
jgi:hypothetical protein